ncbi:uncharacterized protein LOC127836668 isoform X1 [Dreissena polymorpha]|uniref:uncharacterized protein LOC127836668 isoform X1 n=1 Tax=Dreissena polymorpha TaxID=45954 RepID=UPI002264BED9|nr:uncharacterized protein LOC127836668 isoform X1 [Dreissena polymorpha]XP_052219322.1 uncharacterized protein LOC127836668 isoform X1 [Dreissena polymorpha]XP_052219323.1 uncharacterized protein LOC127836668 isoform X1 [Dreissena polymorpha]
MTVNNAVIIIWIVIILMVSSVSLSGVSSCSINLIATTAAFNLGTNVTLTCTVCTVESGIEFKHNGTNIASYGFDIQVVNATLHKASVKENGDGSAEMTLTIFNLAKSSNGVYSCSTSPSDSSSLTLAYTESKPTTDDGSTSTSTHINNTTIKPTSIVTPEITTTNLMWIISPISIFLTFATSCTTIMCCIIGHRKTKLYRCKMNTFTPLSCS